MKIYISADIEGITGVTHWDETELGKADSSGPRNQMTAEVLAACEGAIQAGATEIWVKDAHDSGRNLDASKLPAETRLVRSWAPDPLMMMQGLDGSFHAAIMIGYHSRAGSNTSPLAHTLNTGINRIRINGRDASEFLINAYSTANLGVPVIFLSGDGGICAEATGVNPNIQTVAVKEGVGNSTVSIHPELAVRRIKDGVMQAMKGDLGKCRLSLPSHFSLDVEYKEHTKAHLYSYYPEAVLLDPLTVRYENDRYDEILRFLLFAG